MTARFVRGSVSSSLMKRAHQPFVSTHNLSLDDAQKGTGNLPVELYRKIVSCVDEDADDKDPWGTRTTLHNLFFIALASQVHRGYVRWAPRRYTFHVEHRLHERLTFERVPAYMELGLFRLVSMGRPGRRAIEMLCGAPGFSERVHFYAQLGKGSYAMYSAAVHRCTLESALVIEPHVRYLENAMVPYTHRFDIMKALLALPRTPKHRRHGILLGAIQTGSCAFVATMLAAGFYPRPSAAEAAAMRGSVDILVVLEPHHVLRSTAIVAAVRGRYAPAVEWLCAPGRKLRITREAFVGLERWAYRIFDQDTTPSYWRKDRHLTTATALQFFAALKGAIDTHAVIVRSCRSKRDVCALRGQYALLNRAIDAIKARYLTM